MFFLPVEKFSLISLVCVVSTYFILILRIRLFPHWRLRAQGHFALKEFRVLTQFLIGFCNLSLDLLCSSMCDSLICTETLRSIFTSLRNCTQRFSSALSVNTPQCKFFIWGIEKSATCQVFKSHLIWGSRRPPPPFSSSCRFTPLLWGMFYSAWQFLVHRFRSKAHFLSQTAGFRCGSCRVVVLPRRRYLRSMEAWRLVARWRTSLLVKERCWGEKKTH